jgi:FkbM family methyltransferase
MTMKTVFLDCGSHHLEGLASFIDSGVVKIDYEIHTFEANPECKVSERLENFKYKNLNCTVHNKAVWVSDGSVFFNQENHKQSMSGSPTDGASDLDGWGSSINGIGFVHRGYSTPVEVESVDLSKFIKELPQDRKIICKLDIEGSEFEVLRKMIAEGTIDRISELYVEFHERFMPNESPESEKKLIEEISARGVKVHTWF